MYQVDQLIEQVETPRVIVGKRKDGIIHVFYKKGTVIDTDLQLEMVQIYQRITGYKKTPFIFEAASGVTMTKEARLNATNLEDEACIAHSVVLAQNIFHRIIGEFFLKVNKPKSSYRVFSNFEESIRWLNSIQL